jgi:hypothetical protein
MVTSSRRSLQVATHKPMWFLITMLKSHPMRREKSCVSV